MGGLELALVLQAARVQRQQLRLGDLSDHPGQLLLNQLMGGDGPVVELLADHGVLPRRLIAIHGGAEHAPADAVARLGEAAERAFQSFGARQHGTGRERGNRRRQGWR